MSRQTNHACTRSIRHRRDEISQRRRLVTDGGTQERDEKKHLQNLFVAVTGTDEVIEEQQKNPSKRPISHTEDETLTGYVAEVALQDGLEDTVSEPDTERS